ncbi:DUF222 domain-containing protein, partial [Mycobacterium sp. C31M]
MSVPETVQTAATFALMLINQDGPGPDVARHTCGIRVGKQDADGLTHISGWVDAETAAYLGTAFDVWARPGINNPDDPEPRHNPDPNPPDEEPDTEPAPTAQPEEADAESASEAAPEAEAESEAAPECDAEPGAGPEPESEVAPQPAAPSEPGSDPGSDGVPSFDDLPEFRTFDDLADRMDAVAAADAKIPRPSIDFEALADRAAVRDTRTPAQRRHDALKV